MKSKKVFLKVFFFTKLVIGANNIFTQCKFPFLFVIFFHFLYLIHTISIYICSRKQNFKEKVELFDSVCN